MKLIIFIDYQKSEEKQAINIHHAIFVNKHQSIQPVFMLYKHKYSWISLQSAVIDFLLFYFW